MECAYDGALDLTTLGILFSCVKQGLPLTEVCADLQLKVPTVLRALSEKASISAKTLEIALRMRENGKSLQDICDLCEVPMASLLEILPGDATKKKSPNSQATVSHSIEVLQISEVEAVDLTEPARQELPRKRRATSSATTASKRCKKGTKKWSNGDSYEGELFNRKPQGHGAMYYADGKTYIGDWVSGMKEGRGEFSWPSGDSYEGELLNGEPHGNGAMHYADGGIYIGDWVSGRKEGQGVFSWPCGDSYQGELLNGEPHGHGAMHYADGGIYIGDWVSGKKEGRGVSSWPNGDSYEGEFVNNQRHGYGTFNCSDERVFTGSFHRDKKHGLGVLVMSDGGKYTGTWINSRKNGRFLYEKGDTSRTEVWAEGTLEEEECLLA
jgi:hypothetical protein